MGAQSQQRWSLYRTELVHHKETTWCARPEEYKYVSRCGFLAWLLWPPNADSIWFAKTQLGGFICLITSCSVVLQNSAALLNFSSFCFSLFRQPCLAVDIRPLARWVRSPLDSLMWLVIFGWSGISRGAMLVLEYWSLVCPLTWSTQEVGYR